MSRKTPHVDGKMPDLEAIAEWLYDTYGWDIEEAREYASYCLDYDTNKEKLDNTYASTQPRRAKTRAGTRKHIVDHYVPEAQVITLRAGNNDAVDITIQTRRGEFGLLCIPREGRTIRVVNLRPRDKRKTAKERGHLARVPFDAFRKGEEE